MPNLERDESTKPGWKGTTEGLLVGAVCAVSLAVRLYALQFQTLVNWDGAFYINYFHDRTWQLVFPPGYPLVIELFRLIVPDGVRAAQLVSLAAGAILPVPLYYLGRKFMRPLPALLTAALVILNPIFIRFSVVTMSESLFVLLNVAMVLFFLNRRPVLFGLAAGLAYLTRPEGLLTAGILIAVDLIRRRDWKFAGLFGASCLVLLLPYVIYVKAETGTWTLSPKTMNFRVREASWRANVARESSSTPAPTLSERASSSLGLYPARALAYTGLLLRFGGVPLMLLSLFGIVRFRNILLAGLPMLLILPVFGLDPADRFIMPYLPFLALFAMMALGISKRAFVVPAGALLMLLGFAPQAAYAVEPEEGITEFCTAGMAMRPITRPTDIFVDRKPYTAFYAGGRYAEMPNDPVDSILAFSRRIDAKYLVVSARVVRVFRPQLNFLLYSDTTLSHLHLKTAYVAGLDSGYGIRVIQLQP